MKLVCASLSYGLVAVLGCVLAACATSDPPHSHPQSFQGHVEVGAPFFNFVPSGTREHWQIVGSDACARQLQSFLATQPEYHEPRSDSGTATAAYVELVGVRFEAQLWYDTDHHDVRLRVERVLQMHPAQAEFVRAASHP